MENGSGKHISFKHDFPLHYFSRVGDHLEIQSFLKTGKDELFRKDFYGRSPLHYAVTTGKSHIVAFKTFVKKTFES